MKRKSSNPGSVAKPQKIMVVLHEDDVAPRFDLALGLFITEFAPDGSKVMEKTLVLPHPSAEDLCRLILTEKITVLICGGIEQEYFDYLTWKEVRVIDSVIGDYQWAVSRCLESHLQSGDIQRSA